MKGDNMKVIDISQFNGAVDFSKVSRDIGVIIRVGYRGYGSTGRLAKDKLFAENIEGATKAGLVTGVYFVTQAVTEKEAVAEADYVIGLIKDYSVKLGVYFDSENGNNGKGRADSGKLTKEQRTALANAFVNRLDEKGYVAGVYASESWFNNNFVYSELKGKKWIAKYSSIAPKLAYDGWQYTSKGRVDGVNGNVDVSNFFMDIKTEKKSNETIASEVLAGKWGNGEARKTALIKAGYDYEAIQAIVNDKLSKPSNSNSPVYYTVKAGDTLGKIAKKYNVTVYSLVYLNKISNPNFITVGQRLKIK